MNRKLIWAVPGLALLALGFAFGMRAMLSAPFVKTDAPIEEMTAVISLYNERPSVHVADVGVGPKGAKFLSSGDPEIGYDLKAALTELSTRPFLPAMEDGAEGGDATLGVSEIKPGDERYAWAVAGFLRERTGLRYEIRPYAKPKTP